MARDKVQRHRLRLRWQIRVGAPMPYEAPFVGEREEELGRRPARDWCGGPVVAPLGGRVGSAWLPKVQHLLPVQAQSQGR